MLNDYELGNESEPLSNSTIITYENVKPQEDKSIQTENSLHLVDCEEELIGETFSMIPDNFYYDSWHTQSMRICPLYGCSVSMYGDIFCKGTNSVIGTVYNKAIIVFPRLGLEPE